MKNFFAHPSGKKGDGFRWPVIAEEMEPTKKELIQVSCENTRELESSILNLRKELEDLRWSTDQMSLFATVRLTALKGLLES